MKNKFIYKFFIFFFLFRAVPEFIFSQEISFEVKPFSGIEFSSVNENYYYENSGNLKSLLEWEENPSFYAGLEGRLNYGSTSLKIKGDVKLPLKCGKMFDSDYTESGMKYTYSINENSIVRGYDAEASLSHAFAFDSVILTPEICGSWSFISFKARDGYGWYGSWEHSSDGKTHCWSDPEAHYYPDGKKHLGGVDYKNHTVSVFTGLSVSKEFNSRWQNSIGLYAAPFTYVYAKDTHVGSISFSTEDYIYSCFRNFKITGSSVWKLSEKFSLHISGQYEFFLESKGEDYFDGYKNDSDGGASFNKLRFEIGVQYKLKKRM